MPTIFGTSIKRREDPRLITGTATYTDDLTLPGMAYAAIVRSPHAHARVKGIDASATRSMPGVLGVFTGEDMKAAGFGGIPCAWVVPGSNTKTPPHPAMATETVRYVGDAVAVVVAEDRYLARDAADAVQVDYEPWPAVVDAYQATQPGAPQLHADVPNNVDFHWTVQGGDVETAFRDAAVVVRDRIVNRRLIPNAMEPRSALAQWNAAMGEITLWSTTQNPHIARFLLSGVSGVGEHKIRVIAPEVGGGFGSKIPFYPDEAIAVFCARALKRPVKWTETRSESYRVTIHGRDHLQQVEMAATRDGVITGLRATVWANLGAYLSTASTGIPTILHGLMLSGAYDIPNIREDVYGVFTNTAPVDAYRGAGRPEATFLVERLVDLLARELAMDPAEIRRKNFLAPFTEGRPVATGVIYDSGNYEPALDKALEMVGYTMLRREQGAARDALTPTLSQRERENWSPTPDLRPLLGIGLCTYVEICGVGPSAVVGAAGFGGGLWESAIVRFHPTGKVNVMVGVSPHGQGEETTFAQIVAEELGVPVEDVEVLHGDTDQTPMGWGTYGSRTTVVGGAALFRALGKIKEKAILLAAHLLEVSPDDIELVEGVFSVRGSPHLAKTIQEIALQANLAWNLPEGMEPGLEASAFYDPTNFTFPFGAHVAVVEVDPDTGEVAVKRYVAVDDCGRVVNPMIVDGQVHGGVVQGIGPALWEGAFYGDDGQLLTGSMMDYALPKAEYFPTIETARTETPSPHNPLGVKGVGETGTIAATICVYNAVMDALAPLGVTAIDMPLTPERVWRAIQGAQR
jgi:carbon-monoxide dehydrogenase large subunit